MTSFSVAELKEGQRFPSTVILDKHFIVLDNNISFSKALQTRLIEWGFKNVFTSDESVLPKPLTKEPEIINTNETVEIDLDTLNEEYKDKSNVLNAELKEILSDVNNKIKTFPNKDRLKNVKTAYNAFLDYTQLLFTRYVTHKKMKIEEISESVTLLIDFIKNNKKYILRIQPSEEHKLDKNFLTSHCLRTTIISIIIGLQINMPPMKIVELGIAGLIHEIGQIKLPPQLYLTNKPLLPQARNLLATHTVLGYNIVKEMGFSLAIQVGVLEHHERENGQGYPRHLMGEKISVFGKILSVACSYEAITSPRQYKAARTMYEATIEMLLNKNKQYDDVVIKALVQAVSLYPIGSYVYLANGKIAQVAESNPSNPKMPIVEIIGEKNELGNPKNIITDNDKYKIVRVLNREELKGVQAYIEN